jgi:hypothetical protein
MSQFHVQLLLVALKGARGRNVLGVEYSRRWWCWCWWWWCKLAPNSVMFGLYVVKNGLGI